MLTHNREPSHHRCCRRCCRLNTTQGRVSAPRSHLCSDAVAADHTACSLLLCLLLPVREGAADLLYGVAAPTQTRPARSARALWACCGRPSCPGGGIQRTVRREPAVVRAETSRRARVALLSTQGGSVGHQGGGNARIAFPSPPPNLLLQDSVPAGRAASWAPRQSLRKTHIDSIPP